MARLCASNGPRMAAQAFMLIHPKGGTLFPSESQWSPTSITCFMCHLSHLLILSSYKFALYSTYYSPLLHAPAALKSRRSSTLCAPPKISSKLHLCLLFAPASQHFSKIVLQTPIGWPTSLWKPKPALPFRYART